jgi:hypothetical protein
MSTVHIAEVTHAAAHVELPYPKDGPVVGVEGKGQIVGQIRDVD